MQLPRTRWLVICGGFGLFLASVMLSSHAATSDKLRGEAFGIGVESLVAQVDEHVPHVVLPESGGQRQDQVKALATPLSSAALLTVTTSGSVGSISKAVSVSTVENMDLLVPLPYYYGVVYLGALRITAERVVAKSTSTRNGTASSTAEGSKLSYLRIDNGYEKLYEGATTPEPNTQIILPGVGRIILNERIRSGNGTTSTGLTVNMIRIELLDADIIVGSAHSGVN